MLKEIFGTSYEELKQMDIVEKSETIVVELFKDKKDKSNSPYINHLRYVASHGVTDDAKAVGFLHDLLEDTSVTEEDLKNVGFEDNIIIAIRLLTRDKSKYSYTEYIDRLINSKNDLAIGVKKIDLENNMDLNRFKTPSLKDYDRVEKKYKPAYRKVIEYLGDKK